MSKSSTFTLLAIDGDPRNLASITEALSQEGLEILTANDPESGFELFLQARPKTVVLGLAMPEAAMDLLERMVSTDPSVNVILVSDHYSADSAVKAIQKGACDYLTKPIDRRRLRHQIATFLAEAEVRQKTLSLDQELIQTCKFEGIVSRSPLMLDVFAKMRRVAPHFKTALITGSTGTGKELVARALHNLSPAPADRIVVCNCSTLVESLVESELFGYVKGAFTGAIQDKSGLFESADGGTIFLDEIGELTPSAQAKLLRVLQDHRVRRVGSSVAREVDFRVIAATNRDLRSMVREGKFREDLYYRLAVVEISLPELSNRREDLPLLERYFLEKFALEYGKPIAGLTRRAQARMATYPWPGNIRELESVIGNACMMTDGKFVDINDLPERIRGQSGDQLFTDEALFSLEEMQRRHVMRVLERVGGNKARAAEILGVGRATIYLILSRMKLEKPGESASTSVG
ncbi:MAG TPA: sigma-54 dependent transcriptional regulator [Terriglobales bacterium]|nr:sigma-54 dependent transcriptional regulator [Terriglobales bacterium]